MDDAAKTQLAAQAREFCKSPVFILLQEHIASKVADSRNDWLRAESSIKAEEIRLQAKPWLEIETFLKRLMLEGDAAFNRIKAESQHEM